jgi:hypothetical protein
LNLIGIERDSPRGVTITGVTILITCA